MKIPELVEMIDDLMPTGKYHYVTPASAAAVCVQESDAEPCFTAGSAHLMQYNLKAASLITNMPEAMLLDAMKIPAGPMAGQIAKFRCEPGYWQWAGAQKLPSATERFQASCSVGIGQQMLRWILPPGHQGAWPSLIEHFMCDVNVQLEQVIHTLEALLKSTEGDLLRAYCAYNSGNAHSHDQEVLARAKRVVYLRDSIERQCR